MGDEYRDPQSVASLPVLPHSGKVDQLRREAEAEQSAGANVTGAMAGTDISASPAEAVAPPTGPAPTETASNVSIERKLLAGKVIAAISEVYDPEIPVNVYELGLIYNIDISPDNVVKIKMTLTAPGCPVAGSLPADVARHVEAVPEVREAEVELVWEPTWTKDRMSEAALLQLGML